MICGRRNLLFLNFLLLPCVLSYRPILFFGCNYHNGWSSVSSVRISCSTLHLFSLETPNILFTALELRFIYDGRRSAERNLNTSVNTNFNTECTPLPSPPLGLKSRDRPEPTGLGKYRGPYQTLLGLIYLLLI